MTIRAFFGSPTGLVACLAIAAIGGWLLWSHTGHVLSALPFLLLLACPLLHLLHRGHAGHGAEHGKSTKRPTDNIPRG